MDVARVFRKPKLLRALTTLNPGEFERLLGAFDAAWQAQLRGPKLRRADAPAPPRRWPQRHAGDQPREAFPFVVLLQVLPLAGSCGYALWRQPRLGQPGWQAAINKVVSKVRVSVEHTTCVVKRCRPMADTFRNLRRGLVDAAMEIASGLHNPRVVIARRPEQTHKAQPFLLSVTLRS